MRLVFPWGLLLSVPILLAAFAAWLYWRGEELFEVEL